MIRNYNLANFDTNNNDLLSTDWDSEVFNSDNVNDVYSYFTNKLEECISRNIQTKTITVRPNDKPFMNNEIRLKMRQRNQMYRKA